MDGNHKITKAEVYGTIYEAKCPECGDKDIEDCSICGAYDGECGESERQAWGCTGLPKDCTERKDGLKCLRCNHVWRD